MIRLKSCHTQDSNRFALSISNPYEDDHGPEKCNLNIALFKKSWWFEIPQLFKPIKKWVDLSDQEWASAGKDGKKGYFSRIRREYGFSVDYEALLIRYGIQPGSWSRNDPKNSDHSLCYFIPWNETRRVRYEFFEELPDGEHVKVCSVSDNPNGSIRFDDIEEARSLVPKISFTFNDYDGEEIEATCYIEEMEWRYGVKMFKWVSLFRKPIIKKKLDISFNKEVGRQKGSWKGGTTAHAIVMLHGETAEQAFIRYGNQMNYEKYHGDVQRDFTNIKKVC